MGSQSVGRVEADARSATRRWWGSARRSSPGPWRPARGGRRPARSSCAVMARDTWSRGSSSSTNWLPSLSRSRAPWPRRASESSGRGISGWCRAVGWNWTNSMSASTDTRPQRHGDAVAGGLGRVGGDGEDLAGAARGHEACGGPGPRDHRPVGVERGDAPAAAPLHEQVDGEGVLVHPAAVAGPRPPGPARPRRRWPPRRRGRCGARSGRPRGPGPARPGRRGRRRRRRRSARGPGGGPRRPAPAPRPSRRGRRRPRGCRRCAGRGSRGPRRARRPPRPGPSGWWPGRSSPLVSRPTRRPMGARGADGGGEAGHPTPEDQQVQLGRHCRGRYGRPEPTAPSSQTSKLKWSLASSSPRVISSSTTTSPRTRTSRVAVVGESSQSPQFWTNTS